MAGVDMDRLRDAIETMRAQGGMNVDGAPVEVCSGAEDLAREAPAVGLAEDSVVGLAAVDVGVAGAGTFAASIRGNLMAQFSGWAATRR